MFKEEVNMHNIYKYLNKRSTDVDRHTFLIDFVTAPKYACCGHQVTFRYWIVSLFIDFLDNMIIFRHFVILSPSRNCPGDIST